MNLDEARSVLGLRGNESLAETRSAYRAALRSAHPDVSSSPSANGQTQSIIEAFSVVRSACYPTAAGDELPGWSGSASPGGTLAPHSEPSSETSSETNPTPTSGSATSRDYAVLVDDETIAVDAPDHETFASLLRVGHEIGDVTYLDRQNYLLEVLLRTIHNDTLSLVITLQGRANETTEAFLTVEPLDVSVKELPTMQGISMLVAHHLNYQNAFGA